MYGEPKLHPHRWSLGVGSAPPRGSGWGHGAPGYPQRTFPADQQMGKTARWVLTPKKQGRLVGGGGGGNQSNVVLDYRPIGSWTDLCHLQAKP